MPNSGLEAAGAVAAGAGVGAAVYTAVGGIGVAAGGTAVGITLGPFLLIGSGLGAVGYGLYWLGKQMGGGGSPNTPPSPPAQPLGPSNPNSGRRITDR